MLFQCNNEAVCAIWHKGSTKQPEVMALVCMLYFCAAQFNIHVLITQIAGTSNDIADSLSHLQMRPYRQLAPHAANLPDFIPAWPTQFWMQCSFNISTYIGVALSTRRTYQAGVRSYLQFCDSYNIVPFPASSLTLHYFCSYIAQCISHKTIKVYLSGIR